jgi:hypothetical protein
VPRLLHCSLSPQGAAALATDVHERHKRNEPMRVEWLPRLARAMPGYSSRAILQARNLVEHMTSYRDIAEQYHPAWSAPDAWHVGDY